MPSTGTWLRQVAPRASHWQLGGGSPEVFRPSVHGGWLRSAASVIGETDRVAPGEAPSDVLETVWLGRDDQTIGRLWLTPSGLRWCDEQGLCREADVDRARMRDLLLALPR